MFDSLSEKFDSAFKHLRGKGKISESNIEDTLKDVKTALLEADVNFKVVKNFVQAVKDQSIGQKVITGVNPGEQFVKIMHDELTKLMGDETPKLNIDRPGVSPILVVGLNGQGKTTFTGKLALYLRNKEKKDVLVVPADTFRPAAKDQLITLAKNIGVDYYDSNLQDSPQEIARKAIIEAETRGKHVVIIDTAGRLHVDDQLMDELKQLRQSLHSFNPEVLMVADAMTGQEAVNVAKTFHDSIELTGIVLSKMDSDARGGAALSIKHVTGVPIRFVSMGEKMKDLELFHPDRMAKRILDMGDVISLVEKAEEAIDQQHAEQMMKNMEKGRFTVDDFMKQMNMISKLGSMGSILKMIPGMGGALRQIGDLSPAEEEMKRMKVIISSMTKEERDNYKIVKSSRIDRIARGSGTSQHQVNDFIKKFSQMEKMMGTVMQMMKGGGMPNMPGMPGGGMPQFPGMPGGKKKKDGKKNGPWGNRYF